MKIFRSLTVIMSVMPIGLSAMTLHEQAEASKISTNTNLSVASTKQPTMWYNYHGTLTCMDTSGNTVSKEHVGSMIRIDQPYFIIVRGDAPPTLMTMLQDESGQIFMKLGRNDRVYGKKDCPRYFFQQDRREDSSI